MLFRKTAVGLGLAAVIAAGMFATTGPALAASNDYVMTFYKADHWAAASYCQGYANSANQHWTEARHSWDDWFYCADGPVDNSANLWVRRP
ncbi:hypothetical protein [Kutzneria sp. NPDC052558]|uniref:hypothetical protein n=1 Tax=Kutzneria sp. NPDC052558 TaxID=3364121 RepID=UPI0037C9101B